MKDYGERLTQLLAARIQQLRLARGWSLEQLADAAGLHRTSVGLIMRGRRGMTVASAASLAVALDTSLSTVLAAAEADLGEDEAS